MFATQRKALRRWETEKPYLLVASPPYTAFSVLQNLTRDKREAAEVQAELDAAIQHFAFAIFLCLKPAADGSKFDFEHPVGASLWQLALVNKALRVDDAERVNFDFCSVGMTIAVQGAVLPVKKRTSVVINFCRLTRALRQRQCPGLHAHANTMGGRIKQCEVYPDMFCEPVCREVLSERTEADCGVDDRDITAEMNFLMCLEP